MYRNKLVYNGTERGKQRADCASFLFSQCCVHTIPQTTESLPSLEATTCGNQCCVHAKMDSVRNWREVDRGRRSRHTAYITSAKCQSWRTHAKLTTFECVNEHVCVCMHRKKCQESYVFTLTKDINFENIDIIFTPQFNSYTRTVELSIHWKSNRKDQQQQRTTTESLK